jgi:hypothetical protein
LDNFDDGATEEDRLLPHIVEPEDVAGLEPGGQLALARQMAEPALRDFLLYRGPLGAVKITLGHAPVLKALWRAWSRKRQAGEDDPGVTVGEVAEEMGSEPSAIRHILNSLIRNRAVRSAHSYVGWQGSRAHYYPTQASVQALAFAEVLPAGSLVQVGRTSKAWQSRQNDAVPDLFQYAALLRGGASQGV